MHPSRDTSPRVALYPMWGVFIVGLGTLVVPFDSSVNVAFPHNIRAFDLPIPAIQWVVIAYTLTYAALMLVFGRVGDILGHRLVFRLGCAASTAAFLFCAAAPSYHWLLAARVTQGIGAAMALSCGPALATALYPESQRTRVLGYYTMVFGFGGALGPILAGELVRYWGWPAVFWFRAPIALAACALAGWLPKGVRPNDAKFDALGAILLVTAVTALLVALNQLRDIGQSAAGFLAAGTLTIISAAGFVVREHRTPQPIIDLRYFKNPDFAVVNVAQIALNLAGFSIMLLVPFYLDRFSGLSIPASGLMLTASPVGIMLAGPVAGRIAGWVPPRRLALTGAIAMAVAQIVIGFTGEVPIVPLLAGAMVLQGFGLGLFQVAYFDIATATIPREERGVAGSLVMMTRTVGVVTAATVLMLIFQTMRASALASGIAESGAFLVGFHGAFRLASLLPVLVVVAGLWRGWARRGADLC